MNEPLARLLSLIKNQTLIEGIIVLHNTVKRWGCGGLRKSLQNVVYGGWSLHQAIPPHKQHHHLQKISNSFIFLHTNSQKSTCLLLEKPLQPPSHSVLRRQAVHATDSQARYGDGYPQLAQLNIPAFAQRLCPLWQTGWSDPAHLTPLRMNIH